MTRVVPFPIKTMAGGSAGGKRADGGGSVERELIGLLRGSFGDGDNNSNSNSIINGTATRLIARPPATHRPAPDTGLDLPTTPNVTGL